MSPNLHVCEYFPIILCTSRNPKAGYCESPLFGHKWIYSLFSLQSYLTQSYITTDEKILHLLTLVACLIPCRLTIDRFCIGEHSGGMLVRCAKGILFRLRRSGTFGSLLRSHEVSSSASFGSLIKTRRRLSLQQEK